MLTVKEAKRTGLIKPEYHSFIDDICTTDSYAEDGCGADLVVNETLSVLQCSNPRCNIKLASRCASMLNDFGITGAGFKFCKKFITLNGYGSHLNIFLVEVGKLEITGYSAEARKLFREIQQIKSRVYTFPQLVSFLNLPGLDTRAKDVFSGCKSLLEFYALCDALSVSVEDYIKSIPGFGDILASQIADTIETFELELLGLSAIFKIKPEAKVVWNIAVTGGITKLSIYVNRKDFPRYLNYLGKGLISFEVGKSLQSCKYIVADDMSSCSSTCEAGKHRQQKAHQRYLNDKELFEKGLIPKLEPEERILVSSDELEEIVKREVEFLKGGVEACQSLEKLMSL